MALQLLQIPGAPELIIVLLIGVVLFGVSLAITYWVYSDANERGNENAALWGVVTFLGLFVLGPFGLVVPLVYVLVVRE